MRLAPLPATRRTYWHDARSPRYSYAFAIPLFLLYEGLAFLMHGASGGVRNGADVLLKAPFIHFLGTRGPLLFVGALAVVLGVAMSRDIRANGRLRWGMFLGMLAESTVLAALFGVVVGTLTAWFLGAAQRFSIEPAGLGLPSTLMVSLGAGLYEELLFRVILVGALTWLSRRLFGWGPVASGVFAVVLGALVFSGFHYVGAYGDTLTLPSFTFRALAGLAFSGLYVLRGFGITAWTHALYDVMLLVVGAG